MRGIRRDAGLSGRDETEIREIDDGINAFLGDHIAGLRQMTLKRKTSAAGSWTPEARRLFRALFTGPDEALRRSAEAAGSGPQCGSSRRTCVGRREAIGSARAPGQAGGSAKRLPFGAGRRLLSRGVRDQDLRMPEHGSSRSLRGHQPGCPQACCASRGRAPEVSPERPAVPLAAAPVPRVRSHGYSAPMPP